MKYLAFDLEVARWNDEQKNLGITCAAVAYRTNSGIKHLDWWEKQPELTQNQAKQIVDDLETAVNKGWAIVTVNGGAFDFKVLAETSGEWERCKGLALTHIDLLAVVYAHRGHRLGLDAMAQGAEVKSKLKSVKLNDGSTLTEMDGSKAPEMWVNGEYNAVLEYLYQDCETTLSIAQKFDKLGQIKWVSKAGKNNTINLNQPLGEMNLSWCLTNTCGKPHWMNDWQSLEEFIGWL